MTHCRFAAREAQIGLDRRQRDVHHRRVEDHHELREADDDEHQPAVGLAAREAALRSRRNARKRRWTLRTSGVSGEAERGGGGRAAQAYQPALDAARLRSLTGGCGEIGIHAAFRSPWGNPVEVRVLSAASSAGVRCYPARRFLPLSSRGLGRRPLTAETGVRIPVAVPHEAPQSRGFRRFKGALWDGCGTVRAALRRSTSGERLSTGLRLSGVLSRYRAQDHRSEAE